MRREASVQECYIVDFELTMLQEAVFNWTRFDQLQAVLATADEEGTFAPASASAFPFLSQHVFHRESVTHPFGSCASLWSLVMENAR